MAHKTECAVCGKEIEVTNDAYKNNTEPFCEEHREAEEVDHG